jgi:hypothetical protein
MHQHLYLFSVCILVKPWLVISLHVKAAAHLARKAAPDSQPDSFGMAASTTPEGAYRGKPKASEALNFLLTRQGLPGKPESLPTLPAPCQLYEACLGFSGQGLVLKS